MQYTLHLHLSILHYFNFAVVQSCDIFKVLTKYDPSDKAVLYS